MLTTVLLVCVRNVDMRILKRSMPVAYSKENPQAESGLLYWHKLTKAARWSSLGDVRATFPRADAVTVKSGRTVVVFNIAGNKYRLITAIHYNRRKVFTLMVLTYAEYSRGRWKDVL